MYDSEKKLLKSNFWNEDLDVLGFSKCYHPPLPAYKETPPPQSLGTNSVNHGKQWQSQVSVKSV